MRSLFHALGSNRSADVKARVEVSYIEVYNEEVNLTFVNFKDNVAEPELKP